MAKKISKIGKYKVIILQLATEKYKQCRIGGEGRISSIYPTVFPEQKQGCTATDSLPMITMISTDTNHMNDVGTFYSHGAPRRVRVILSKGSYNSHSFIHLLQYSLSIQLEAKQVARSHRTYKIE